jgi:hypothetical protein
MCRSREDVGLSSIPQILRHFLMPQGLRTIVLSHVFQRLFGVKGLQLVYNPRAAEMPRESSEIGWRGPYSHQPRGDV